MTSQIIKAGGAQSVATPANGKTWRLKELQKIVGGNIEVISLENPEWPYNTMVLNEEGKLIGLPMNHEATKISGLWPHDVVMGDVLLCNTDDEGEMI